jgi:hypothetical protein
MTPEKPKRVKEIQRDILHLSGHRGARCSFSRGEYVDLTVSARPTPRKTVALLGLLVNSSRSTFT